MTSTFYELSDIHSKIKDLSAGSIDLIYTSPPYGITNAEWDKPLNWTELFPTTTLEYKTRYRSGGGITRPDVLISYFIKTYSNVNDLILDMTCCNNICSKVVNSLNRNYIGIDIREIGMLD